MSAKTKRMARAWVLIGIGLAAFLWAALDASNAAGIDARTHVSTALLLDLLDEADLEVNSLGVGKAPSGTTGSIGCTALSASGAVTAGTNVQTGQYYAISGSADLRLTMRSGKSIVMEEVGGTDKWSCDESGNTTQTGDLDVGTGGGNVNKTITFDAGDKTDATWLYNYTQDQLTTNKAIHAPSGLSAGSFGVSCGGLSATVYAIAPYFSSYSTTANVRLKVRDTFVLDLFEDWTNSFTRSSIETDGTELDSDTIFKLIPVLAGVEAPITIIADAVLNLLHVDHSIGLDDDTFVGLNGAERILFDSGNDITYYSTLHIFQTAAGAGSTLYVGNASSSVKSQVQILDGEADKPGELVLYGNNVPFYMWADNAAGLPRWHTAAAADEDADGKTFALETNDVSFGAVTLTGILDWSGAPAVHYNLSQNAEPDIPNNTMMIWEDADGGPVRYLLVDIGGNQYKIEIA